MKWVARLGRLLLCVIAAAPACTWHSNEPRGQGGPLVLIVIDTLRADHLTCYGYSRPTTPAICRLADENVTFEHAYTPRTSTTPAIASILTGLYPQHHGVHSLYEVLPQEMETVAEVLHERGYKTGGFVSSFVMVRDFSGLDQGFDVYDDFVQQRELSRDNFERPGADTVDRAVAWLQAAGPHAFLFVHLIEPHGPYTPPSPFLERFALPAAGAKVTAVPAYQRIPGLTFVSEYVGRYDGEIAAADEQVGRLLNTLRTLGWYDSATIVVAADHGESFGEEGFWFEHGHSLSTAESHVPLIIKFAPEATGSAPHALRVAAAVSLVDVFPTLLHAAGVPQRPTSSSAADLRSVAAGEPRTAPAPTTQLRGLAGLLVEAHAAACATRWTFATRELTPSWLLADPAAAPRWETIAAATQPFPASTNDPTCQTQLAQRAAPTIIDLLTYALPVQVVRRLDIKQPGAQSEFVARRGAPVTPLSERERNALRRLGYLK